jgi:hypothetical protein
MVIEIYIYIFYPAIKMVIFHSFICMLARGFTIVWPSHRCWFNHPAVTFQAGKSSKKWGFHSHGGTPIAGWFIREIPIKMDDLGVPPFMDTLKCGNFPQAMFDYHRVPFRLANKTNMYKQKIDTYIGAFYAYIRTYIRTYVRTCIHTYIHTHIHTYIHTAMHACIHPSIHKSMHP